VRSFAVLLHVQDNNPRTLAYLVRATDKEKAKALLDEELDHGLDNPETYQILWGRKDDRLWRWHWNRSSAIVLEERTLPENID
jgi:hypothetical protein